ncbi:hypothetical protein PVT67_05295 [Gallaecimonas kandeliae]|uniref:hypothetical protein n=1 Tax=Gallaecimonas kandeliae TaxID=3029055 RepID=UPI002648BBA9|nr:hypothetical protein [Gallaecimonas kandeliae]WKE66661.1 hypothetical protein PVT67_05295 [Gallaecimonas kandeliae]
MLYAISLPANAKDLPRISGIYSNLEYNEEGGDFLGMEVFIFPSGGEGAYKALVQIAEGGFPFSALVSVKVAGLQVEFTLPKGGEYSGVHFSGSIRKNELILLENQGSKEHLKRGKSYWQ